MRHGIGAAVYRWALEDSNLWPLRVKHGRGDSDVAGHGL